MRAASKSGSTEKKAYISLALCAVAVMAAGIVIAFSRDAAPVRTTPVPELSAGDHVQGDPSAPIQLIVYTDLECPHCKALHRTTIPRLQAEFGTSTLVIVYRHFPLASHLRAPREAVAAECAATYSEEYFWKYVDRVFQETASNDALDPTRLPEIAREIGLPKAAFARCLDEPERMNRVLHDISQGLQADVNLTPTIFVSRNGEMTKVAGNYPLQLSITIEEMLRK